MNKSNPFAPPVPKPAQKVRWGIASSGPPVDPSEVETTQRAAEVKILWGDEVLHVAHVSPPRDVVIGEAGSDYLVGQELLGTARLPIVIEREGRLLCVLPEGASGEVTIGEEKKSFASLESELSPFADLPGAKLYALADGASARVEHRGLAFLVRPTNAGRAIGGTELRVRHTGWIGLSLAVHALFLVMFYFMPPRTSALNNDISGERARMAEYLVEASEVVEPEQIEVVASTESAGGDGVRAAEDEGAMGDQNNRRTNNRYAVQGDRNDPNPELARERVRENMEHIGALGILNSMAGSWDSPTSPFGADQAHGLDAQSALGALMGDQIGANYGFNGLGLTGSGRGAGGFGLGTVGLGRIGTRMGHGAGGGTGDGYGTGAGHLGNRRVADGPTVRLCSDPSSGCQASVRGSLSAEAIRRVVRRHLPEIRFCYEQGLTQNAGLEGRVAVSWVIAPSGSVQSAAVSSSSLSNARVEGCVANAVSRWTFPAPDGGGVVGVNYPFVLQSN